MRVTSKPRIIETGNYAFIQVSAKDILGWMDFEGGRIIDARINSEYFPGIIEFVVNHPDLPEVREGDVLMRISPTYQITDSGKLERIDPPKKEIE